MTSPKTDAILRPFLELAAEYSEKADQKRDFLNKLYSRYAVGDQQILTAITERDIYVKIATQLRERAQQVIQKKDTDEDHDPEFPG
jgi:hypothetical protein